MTRVPFEGVTLDTRTRDMFTRVRWKLELPLSLSQGSYSNATASAGTHSGGGALDVRAATLTAEQRARVVLALRQVGFAAWLRTPSQGDWPYHIHAIAIGTPDLSAAARDQVVDYKAGRNGLANNGPDDGPRGYVDMTWEKYEAAHPDEEWLMTTGDDILTAVKALSSKLDSFVTTEANRYTVDANRYTDIKKALAEVLAEAGTAEDEAQAGGRYSAIQETVNSLSLKVDNLAQAVAALPKA